MSLHEFSLITGSQCKICSNYKHLVFLDKDIDQTLAKNYCKNDNISKCIKISNSGQRIHVIGDHWPLINSFSHRKFSFFSERMPSGNKSANKESICVTDTSIKIIKTDNQMIITQGYSKDYNLSSVDYLLVEKKHIDESYFIPFDQKLIPEKGFLIIDLSNNTRFYTTKVTKNKDKNQHSNSLQTKNLNCLGNNSERVNKNDISVT